MKQPIKNMDITLTYSEVKNNQQSVEYKINKRKPQTESFIINVFNNPEPETVIKIVTKMLKDLDVKTSFSLEYFVDCEFDYDAICQIQNDYIQITYEHRSWTHRVNIALDKFTIENILQEVLSFCEFNYFLDVC